MFPIFSNPDALQNVTGPQFLRSEPRFSLVDYKKERTEIEADPSRKTASNMVSLSKRRLPLRMLIPLGITGLGVRVFYTRVRFLYSFTWPSLPPLAIIKHMQVTVSESEDDDVNGTQYTGFRDYF